MNLLKQFMVNIFVKHKYFKIKNAQENQRQYTEKTLPEINFFSRMKYFLKSMILLTFTKSGTLGGAPTLF